MDFFDPQKQKRHRMRLAIGYAVIGITLLLATTVLLYHARGFGLDKEGRVIQNGLVFVSSRPGDAQIFLNGKKYKGNTNARMALPSGQYVMELKKDGYRDWKRVLAVEGESVERFDYPLLFPVDLKTELIKQYGAAPSLSTESLDRRWLLVSTPEPNKFDLFDLFDLNSREPSVQTLEVPVDALAAGSTTTGWKALEWSKNNRHVLLSRTYDQLGQIGTEYILFDREQPGLSQNLSVELGFTPTDIELRDQNHDEYYVFDQNSGQLFTASLDEPTPQPLVSGGVLAFSSEKDIVAYASTEGANPGKVLIKIKLKTDQSLIVKQVPADTTYLMDMAVYEGKLYLAAGAASENRVFVYADPIGGLKSRPDEALAPIQILKVEAPNNVSFSANRRFVVAENADKFAVYDAEADRGYVYQTGAPMDAPQTHATWMDGFRLTYVSGGQVVVFDFDGANMQKLSPASAGHLPIFDRDYRYMYTLDAQNALTRTALLTPEDL